MKIIALLESMWGWRSWYSKGEEAPRFFRINPHNFSGRRLYSICGTANLLVTNCCRIVQQSASHHGTPDVGYVRENLARAQQDGCDLFLICGKVAKKTYEATGLKYKNVLFMDHPAARRWTKDMMTRVTKQIERKMK